MNSSFGCRLFGFTLMCIRFISSFINNSQKLSGCLSTYFSYKCGQLPLLAISNRKLFRCTPVTLFQPWLSYVLSSSLLSLSSGSSDNLFNSFCLCVFVQGICWCASNRVLSSGYVRNAINIRDIHTLNLLCSNSFASFQSKHSTAYNVLIRWFTSTWLFLIWEYLLKIYA